MCTLTVSVMGDTCITAARRPLAALAAAAAAGCLPCMVPHIRAVQLGSSSLRGHHEVGVARKAAVPSQPSCASMCCCVMCAAAQVPTPQTSERVMGPCPQCVPLTLCLVLPSHAHLNTCTVPWLLLAHSKGGSTLSGLKARSWMAAG